MANRVYATTHVTRAHILPSAKKKRLTNTIITKIVPIVLHLPNVTEIHSYFALESSLL